MPPPCATASFEAWSNRSARPLPPTCTAAASLRGVLSSCYGRRPDLSIACQERDVSNPSNPSRSLLCWGVGLALVALLVLVTLSVASRRPSDGVIQPRPLHRADSCIVLTSEALLTGPVSLAPLDGISFLVCNYTIVQKVDLETGDV